MPWIEIVPASYNLSAAADEIRLQLRDFVLGTANPESGLLPPDPPQTLCTDPRHLRESVNFDLDAALITPPGVYSFNFRDLSSLTDEQRN